LLKEITDFLGDHRGVSISRTLARAQQEFVEAISAFGEKSRKAVEIETYRLWNKLHHLHSASYRQQKRNGNRWHSQAINFERFDPFWN